MSANMDSLGILEFGELAEFCPAMDNYVGSRRGGGFESPSTQLAKWRIGSSDADADLDFDFDFDTSLCDDEREVGGVCGRPRPKSILCLLADRTNEEKRGPSSSKPTRLSNDGVAIPDPILFSRLSHSMGGSVPCPKPSKAVSNGDRTGNMASSRQIAGEPVSLIPCHDSPRDAIKRITVETMDRLLAGESCVAREKIIIVDCRYPYEFLGGHLPGAINVCSLEEIERLLYGSGAELASATNTILVFHCEFSSERAPRMALHVRNLDRSLNADRYPFLNYPHVYVLEGGYKAFHSQHPERCDPPFQYVPMRSGRNRAELRFHQRLRLQDNLSHGKHRRKLRTSSLFGNTANIRKHQAISARKGAALVYPCPELVKLHEQSAHLLSHPSSDLVDICDQSQSIMEAAEALLLSQ